MIVQKITQEQLTALISALQDCEEYFMERAGELRGGGPNKEAKLLEVVKSALDGVE